MTRHVMRNIEVARAFVKQDRDSARNQKNTMRFHRSDRTLYSYQMPIAWYNDYGKLIVRRDGPSNTTKRHIAAARSSASHNALDAIINVPVKKLRNAGVDVNDILDGTCHRGRVTRLVVNKDRNCYTVFSEALGSWKTTSMFVRSSNAVRPIMICLEGIVASCEVNRGKILEALIPQKHYRAMHDGWVCFTGDWLLVGDPHVDNPDPSKKNAFDGDPLYSATEICGEYVRGPVRKHGSIVFSTNVDGRAIPEVWYKPVKPAIPFFRDDWPDDFHKRIAPKQAFHDTRTCP